MTVSRVLHTSDPDLIDWEINIFLAEPSVRGRGELGPLPHPRYPVPVPEGRWLVYAAACPLARGR
jgi:hypothetical protein